MYQAEMGLKMTSKKPNVLLGDPRLQGGFSLDSRHHKLTSQDMNNGRGDKSEDDNDDKHSISFK